MSVNVNIKIFLPVRNGIKYLDRAVTSVLNQSYKSYKLIILDNNSIDGSKEYIEKLKDERIEKIYSDIDLSIFESWQRIYKYAEKTVCSDDLFLTTIGHDDIYNSDFLDIIVELINAFPKCNLFQTNFNIINENDQLVRHCIPIPRVETARDFLLARCYGFRDSFGTGYVFRTSQYLKVGGFMNFPLLLWADDLLVYKAIGSSVKVCSDKLAFSYRAHSSSASGSESRKTLYSYHSALCLFLSEIELIDRKYLEIDVQVREGVSILICRTLDRCKTITNTIPDSEKLFIKSFIKRYKLNQNPDVILTPLRPLHRKVLTVLRIVSRTIKSLF